MSKLEMTISDEFIELLANKVADRAVEIIIERTKGNNLPPLLTREEAMKVLRCGSTTMSELMRRPDFPVIREFGVKIPTHLLMQWIEQNTNKI